MISKEDIERAEKRDQRSQEYEKRYESGDETALREFCRIDLFAIKTGWVQKAIEQCLLSGKMSPLKNLFTGGKKEKKSWVAERTQDLIIKDGIDRAAAETRLPKNQPEPNSDNTVYGFAYNNQLFTFGSAQKMNPKTLLNRYAMANKHEWQIMIERNRDNEILRFGPVKGTKEGKSVIGIYEVFFPVDGSEPYFNANGVYNIPTGKDEFDMVPESWKSAS